MNSQTILTGKLLLANGTRYLRFGNVVLLVPLQIGQIYKSFSALRAEILTVADVVTHVSLQEAWHKETLTAAFTHVWAVPCVPALVIGQFEGSWEAFVALFTRKGHLAGVALHVSFKISGLSEALVADVAVEGLLATVSEHVLGETLQFGEALATLATNKRARGAVSLKVVVEESLCAETFVAGSAHEWLLPRVNALVVHQFRVIRKTLITYATCKSIRRRPKLFFPSNAWAGVIISEPGRRERWQGWQ